MKTIALAFLTAIVMVPVAASAEQPPARQTAEQGQKAATAAETTKPDATDNSTAEGEPEPVQAHSGPALRSTTRQYREYAYLNDECRREFGQIGRAHV